MRRMPLPLAALVLLAACTKGEDDKAALLRADIVGDMAEPASPVRAALTQMTQLGLVQFDGAGQLVPGLAASWRTVDDGRSIIFRLRPAVWSDGRALTAGDVVAVFRRIMAPGSTNTLKPLLAGIDNAPSVMDGRAPVTLLGVNAPLPDVVEIRLSSPDAGLLQLLALPEAVIMRSGARPPSTGAFVLKDAGARPIMLTANPRYFLAADNRLGSVAVTPSTDPRLSVQRFVRGQADLVMGDGIAGLGEARTLGPRDTLRLEPSWGVYGYRFNTDREPLSDPRVRRALAMSIDRADIVQRLFATPLMVPLVSLVPPDAGSGANAPAVPDWSAMDTPARNALATQLLHEAGYGPERPLRLTVALPPGREHAQVFDAVARGWALLGVQAAALERAPAAQRDAEARGDYDLALVERRAPTATPLFFLRPFTCAARRGKQGYCNPDADALIEGARAMANEDARAEALGHAEAAMLADTPMIPLFVPVRWALVGRSVTGWTPNQGGQHPFATLDLPARKTP
ncbi:ABC transporter substrate-binding protein [Glacieibacterium sp.]|uniref:ABC transporter substrate-binding protein n=1 Tax=Glacieibacterium sp. TaxID=2860237 RepID=UPI003AFF7C99